MTASDGHKFDPSMLREYDVRGVVGKTLHEEDAHALGRAFGTMVRRSGGTRVAVGRDGRLSSPDLADFQTHSAGNHRTGIAILG